LSASLLVVALAALAVALTSCGSSGNAKLLPGATATQINANLDQVQQLAGEGDCVGAADAAAAVGNQVEELGGVDQKLKQALSEGAERLNEVVSTCEEEEGEEELDEALQEAEEAEAEAKPEKSEKTEKKPKKEKEAPPETIEPPGQEEGEGEPPLGEEEGGPGAGGVGPGEPAEEG
jgi:hypothetical protein